MKIFKHNALNPFNFCYTSATKNMEDNKMKRRKRLQATLLISVLVLITLVSAGCVVVENITTPTPAVTEEPSPSSSPTARPSIIPDKLAGDINIMLIGVDYAPERDTWSGKHMYHSDVMMILNINSETGKVSIISLPRDTYSKIPGVTGIYKLSSSLNCGGDWPSQPACEKVCEAASWMIGEMPIDYYYAVDMTAAKGLVDEIGGIDYDLEISFEINGRSYKRGFQHMSGQAVLDYLRVRSKGIEDNGGNAGTQENRQQKMILAIFQNMKDSGKISDIPGIIDDFKSNNLVTNVPIGQTAALAIFLAGVNSEDIGFHSMDGNIISLDFNYTITNQAKRRQIMQDVYGMDISDQMYADYSYEAVKQLWYEMQAHVAVNQSKGVLDDVKAKLDADAQGKYPAGGEAWKLYEKCISGYEQLKNRDTEAASFDYKAFEEFFNGFKADIESLGRMFSIEIKSNFWNVVYNSRSGEVNQPYVENQIYVDQR